MGVARGQWPASTLADCQSPWLTHFVGRQTELAALHAALAQAGAGHGQVVAVVGEAGVGKSRLVDEFVQDADTQGWLVLDSAAMSYGQATPYFPVRDLLRRYCHLEEGEDTGTIQTKVTEQVLHARPRPPRHAPGAPGAARRPPRRQPFLAARCPAAPPAHVHRAQAGAAAPEPGTTRAAGREDLHWLDTETQALLESLSESLPAARLLLLVTYRPNYRHGWGSKTYYTQLRLDPLPRRALTPSSRPSWETTRVWPPSPSS